MPVVVRLKVVELPLIEETEELEEEIIVDGAVDFLLVDELPGTLNVGADDVEAVEV